MILCVDASHAIWVLLFFNVMSYQQLSTVIPIPHTIGKVLTQGALPIAFLLALTVNRRLLIRPNVILILWSLLATFALMITIRDEVSFGSDYRVVRLVLFILTLWLLTPWWGRKDLTLFRTYIRCLVAILATVLIGMAISPHKAFVFEGRLSGDIWPIFPTQVAHYASVTAGLVVVLWFGELIGKKLALALFLGSTVVLAIYSHENRARRHVGGDPRSRDQLVRQSSACASRIPQCTNDCPDRPRNLPPSPDHLVQPGPDIRRAELAHRSDCRMVGARSRSANRKPDPFRLRLIERFLRRQPDRQQLAFCVPRPGPGRRHNLWPHFAVLAFDGCLPAARPGEGAGTLLADLLPNRLFYRDRPGRCFAVSTRLDDRRVSTRADAASWAPQSVVSK